MENTALRPRTAHLGRVLVVVNPAAGAGRAARAVAPVVERLAAAGVSYDLFESLDTIVPGAALDGVGADDTVLALGGDGTVHSLVAALRSRAGAAPALTALPVGSGNDFARCLGLPSDPGRALESILTGRRMPFDLGLVDGQPFVDSISVGFDARVTRRASEMKERSRLTGLALYGAALLPLLVRDLHGYRFEIVVDGEPLERDLLLVAVCNAPTYGGGFRIAPRALTDDGELDLLTVDPMPLPEALAKLPLLVAGRHEGLGGIGLRRCRHVAIHTETPAPAQVDGELDTGTAWDVGVEPAALTVIAP
jgi:YegS/Rv2252/BmrU family lipid kinase